MPKYRISLEVVRQITWAEVHEVETDNPVEDLVRATKWNYSVAKSDIFDRPILKRVRRRDVNIEKGVIIDENGQIVAEIGS